jgi:hypothetical protein
LPFASCHAAIWLQATAKGMSTMVKKCVCAGAVHVCTRNRPGADIFWMESMSRSVTCPHGDMKAGRHWCLIVLTASSRFSEVPTKADVLLGSQRFLSKQTTPQQRERERERERESLEHGAFLPEATVLLAVALSGSMAQAALRT